MTIGFSVRQPRWGPFKARKFDAYFLSYFEVGPHLPVWARCKWFLEALHEAEKAPVLVAQGVWDETDRKFAFHYWHFLGQATLQARRIVLGQWAGLAVAGVASAAWLVLELVDLVA